MPGDLIGGSGDWRERKIAARQDHNRRSIFIDPDRLDVEGVGVALAKGEHRSLFYHTLLRMTYGKGYLHDPEDIVKRRPGFHLLKAKRKLASTGLPLSVDWSPFVTGNGGPGILNQLQVGACTGFATAAAITVRFALIGSPIKLVSPIGCYAVGRAVGRQPNPDGTLPPLADNGAEPSQVIAGISEWGVCSVDTWGDYPPDPTTINNEPTLTDLEADAEFELDGAYFLQSTDDAFCVDLMTSLANKLLVTNSVAASDPAFNNYTDGILGAMGGGLDHYTYICGYTWDGVNPSSVVIKCANSWGDGSDGGGMWGESGFYRADRSFIDQMSDCCVMDVSSS